MHTFVVERYLTGWESDEIDALLARLDELRTCFERHDVQYVHSILMAGDETCWSIFEGRSAAAVLDANEIADLPTHRVIAAVLSIPPVVGAA
ncbi:MAG: hypothetical protein ACLGHQ_15375 [Acidimicrobiia bacterium]